MDYQKLVETIDGYDLDAAPLAVRLRYLRLTLRASMTFAAVERVEAKYQTTLRRLAESQQREAAELAESLRWSAGNITRPTLDALRLTADERLNRSLKRGRGAVIFCGRHKLATRVLEIVDNGGETKDSKITKKNNAVNLESALNLARRELVGKAPSRPFWGADAAKLNAALDSIDTELIQTALDSTATYGVNSDRSRGLRDEIKRQLAARGLNKFACAGVSCALAHAARKPTTNR